LNIRRRTEVAVGRQELISRRSVGTLRHGRQIRRVVVAVAGDDDRVEIVGGRTQLAEFGLSLRIDARRHQVVGNYDGYFPRRRTSVRRREYVTESSVDTVVQVGTAVKTVGTPDGILNCTRVAVRIEIEFNSVGCIVVDDHCKPHLTTADEAETSHHRCRIVLDIVPVIRIAAIVRIRVDYENDVFSGRRTQRYRCLGGSRNADVVRTGVLDGARYEVDVRGQILIIVEPLIAIRLTGAVRVGVVVADRIERIRVDLIGVEADQQKFDIRRFHRRHQRRKIRILTQTAQYYDDHFDVSRTRRRQYVRIDRTECVVKVGRSSRVVRRRRDPILDVVLVRVSRQREPRRRRVGVVDLGHSDLVGADRELVDDARHEAQYVLEVLLADAGVLDGEYQLDVGRSAVRANRNNQSRCHDYEPRPHPVYNCRPHFFSLLAVDSTTVLLLQRRLMNLLRNALFLL